MYKVNDELWINLKFVSSLYISKRDNRWRLVMVGVEDCDEYPLTEKEAQNIIKELEEQINESV